LRTVCGVRSDTVPWYDSPSMVGDLIKRGVVPMGRRLRRPLPFALLALIVLAAAIASPLALLMLAPALVLVAVLLSGRAPGENLLVRWATRRKRRPRAARIIERQYAAVFVRRVGRLIADALAMRPPPRAPLPTPA
jgi:hypothetical protein